MPGMLLNLPREYVFIHITIWMYFIHSEKMDVSETMHVSETDHECINELKSSRSDDC